ncbi:MAG: ADP-ribosylglycohydrolase family protein [Patescibacteria group bacterium]|nr:ADP-ribosylglycohydrolase family protein [Patescibacteria group bacterium]
MLNRVQGCLLGACLGDAMGMPVETMSHTDIQALNNGRGVTYFMNPVQKRIWDTANLGGGDTTDDWQLTQAVARSIIRNRGTIDIRDCAEEHVKELKKSAFGWGKSTQSAIQDIADGKRDPVLNSLSPTANGQGCGNGVVMKIAPVAIAHAIRYHHQDSYALWEQCKTLGSLTHPDIRASIAAYAVALLMQFILRRKHEQPLHGAKLASWTEETIIRDVRAIEEDEHPSGELVSSRLVSALAALDSVEKLRLAVGCGYYAIDTAAFAIGVSIIHATDFEGGVLAAVNAGKDTDTNASVVGALIGANCGVYAIPVMWRVFKFEYIEAFSLGQQLCSM